MCVCMYVCVFVYVCVSMTFKPLKTDEGCRKWKDLKSYTLSNKREQNEHSMSPVEPRL